MDADAKPTDPPPKEKDSQDPSSKPCPKSNYDSRYYQWYWTIIGEGCDTLKGIGVDEREESQMDADKGR